MKKLLSFLFAFVLVALFVTGCNEANITCETLSENINQKLDKLSLTVTKLDTIDNQYIANPDIYPATRAVTNIVPNPNSPQEVTFDANNSRIIKNIIADNINPSCIKYNLKCDDNGNCFICGNNYGDYDNMSCDSCNNYINCNENGMCNNCNTCLQIDSYGNCTNCNNASCPDSNNISVLNSEAFNQVSKNCADNYKNLLEINQENAQQILDAMQQDERNTQEKVRKALMEQRKKRRTDKEW